jgi:hypothetical protein
MVFPVAYSLNQIQPGSTLFASNTPPDFKFSGFEFVDDVAAADFVLIPNGIPTITPEV